MQRGEEQEHTVSPPGEEEEEEEEKVEGEGRGEEREGKGILLSFINVQTCGRVAALLSAGPAVPLDNWTRRLVVGRASQAQLHQYQYYLAFLCLKKLWSSAVCCCHDE